MSTIIKIKNSGVSGSPSALATGELAYSYLTGNVTNGGDRLYIGTGTEDINGIAANIEVIGGKYFTDKLDHVPGTLTASSALIVDANNKIDIFNVDNLRLDGNTLSSTNTNGDISVAANGTGTVTLSTLGNIVLSGANLNLTGSLNFTGTQHFTGDQLLTGNSHITGTLDVDSQATFASANVEDLTNTRIVLAGVNGELRDDSNFIFDGTTFNVGLGKFTVAQSTGNTHVGGTLGVDGNTTVGGTMGITGNTTVGGTLDVTGLSTLATARVSDLTTGRVTFAGTAGRLVDSANFTYNTSTSNLVLTGDLDVVGSADIDNMHFDGNTISATNSNGDLNLTPNGLGVTNINSSTAIKIPVGNTASRPGAPVAGMIRYNTTDLRYEAYDGTNWTGLGGVIDVDQNTFIRAETTPGANNNDLEFYTDGVKRVNLDENGMVFTDTTIPLQVGKIKIQNDTITTTSGGVLYLDPNPTGPAGSVVIEGNLTINGTTTTVNSTVVTVDDPLFVLGGDTALSAPDGMDKGILFQWHNGTSAKQGFFGYDSSAARFTFVEDATNASEVISGAAANVKFGNALIDSLTFTTGNFLSTSVLGVDSTGNAVFYNEDSASPYGVKGQVLQMSSAGVPSFGHIDCGTY